MAIRTRKFPLSQQQPTEKKDFFPHFMSDHATEQSVATADPNLRSGTTTSSTTTTAPSNSAQPIAGKYVPPAKRAAQEAQEKAAAAAKAKRDAAVAQERERAPPAAPRGPSKWADKGDDVRSGQDARRQGDDRRGGGGGDDRRGGGSDDRRGDDRRGGAGERFSGKGGSGDYRNDGYGGGAQGASFDALGARNERVEKELFGDATENAEKAAGINFAKYDDIPVEMSGNDAPLPITTWDDEDLGPVVENSIKLAGYSRPTPVQRYAIPVIVGARDLMACAQTGSGSELNSLFCPFFFFFFFSFFPC
jgi:hypothetical protein